MTVPLFDRLSIETTGACNRTCTTCLRQSHPSSTPRSLPLLRTVETRAGKGNQLATETIESILRQAKEMGFAGRIALSYFNEPLLDPRLPDLCRLVREVFGSDVRLIFNTNGDLMQREVASAMDGVVDQINIALYMAPAQQAARRTHLRSLFSQTRLTFRSGHAITHHSPHADLREAATAEVLDHPCTMFNTKLAINSSGDISHCCEDVTNEFGLGNIKDTPLRDLWYGPAYADLVRRLAEPGGRREFAYCASCPRPDPQRGERARVAKVRQGPR